jgi:hypothetical protein
MSQPADDRIAFSYHLLAERIYLGVAFSTLLALAVHIATTSLPVLATFAFDRHWWLEAAQSLLLTWAIAYAFASYHILKLEQQMVYGPRQLLADIIECLGLLAVWSSLGISNAISIDGGVAINVRLSWAFSAIAIISLVRIFVTRLAPSSRDAVVDDLRLDALLVSVAVALACRAVPPTNAVTVNVESCMGAGYLWWLLAGYYGQRFKKQ